MNIEIQPGALVVGERTVRLKDVMYNPLNEQNRGVVIGFSIDTNSNVSCILHMYQIHGIHFQDIPKLERPPVGYVTRNAVPLSELQIVPVDNYTDFEKETLLKIHDFSNTIPNELKDFLGKSFVNWSTDRVAFADVTSWTMDSPHVSAKYSTSCMGEVSFIPSEWYEIYDIEESV